MDDYDDAKSDSDAARCGAIAEVSHVSTAAAAAVCLSNPPHQTHHLAHLFWAAGLACGTAAPLTTPRARARRRRAAQLAKCVAGVPTDDSRKRAAGAMLEDAQGRFPRCDMSFQPQIKVVDRALRVVSEEGAGRPRQRAAVPAAPRECVACGPPAACGSRPCRSWCGGGAQFALSFAFLVIFHA